MKNEGPCRKTYQVAGGFPAEISYYSHCRQLSIYSKTSHVSGGDWGSGFQHDYDWEQKIPVYGGDWQRAETKAMRRYEEFIDDKKRSREIFKAVKALKETDLLFRLIVDATEEGFVEEASRLKVAGYNTELYLYAEYRFLRKRKEKDWEETAILAEQYGFTLPTEWSEDRFDDSLIGFTEYCKRHSWQRAEEAIEVLVCLDAPKTKTAISPLVADNGGWEKIFVDFLEKKGLLELSDRHLWARKNLRKMVGDWVSAMLKTAEYSAEYENKPSRYASEHRDDYSKKAITLWQGMGVWCQREKLSWEDAQAEVVARMEEHSTLAPAGLEMFARAFKLPVDLLDDRIIEYLANNVKPDIFALYSEYAERALQRRLGWARAGRSEGSDYDQVLADWVPWTKEDRVEMARAYVQIKLEYCHASEIKKALLLNEKLGLEIPILERFREVIALAKELPREAEKPASSLMVQGKLVDKVASDDFVKLLCLLASRGPSPAIRLNAASLRDWLEYEIKKSFPSRLIVVDVWGALLLSRMKGDVPVGSEVLQTICNWHLKEAEATKDSEVNRLVAGLEEAINEYLLPGHQGRLTTKTLEFMGNKGGEIED